MNECNCKSDPLYHVKVKRYLRNKEIFGNNSKFMFVDGVEETNDDNT